MRKVIEMQILGVFLTLMISTAAVQALSLDDVVERDGYIYKNSLRSVLLGN
ncbi:hypothetical protein N9Y74_01435 [Alphaproteobacteria bacterium]|nr:hypothetical protein [Alphaproteobacteria bacterium]